MGEVLNTAVVPSVTGVQVDTAVNLHAHSHEHRHWPTYSHIHTHVHTRSYVTVITNVVVTVNIWSCLSTAACRCFTFSIGTTLSRLKSALFSRFGYSRIKLSIHICSRMWWHVSTITSVPCSERQFVHACYLFGIVNAVIGWPEETRLQRHTKP